MVVMWGIKAPKVTAWCVLLEFIFTLAMATNCYPLQPGGLIFIQAFAMGLCSAKKFKHEVEMNIDVILLVCFMVACIHFMKNLLLMVFTNVLIKFESKPVLALTMMMLSAVMSAFLDALSVAAVIVSVCTGVLGVYYNVVEHTALPDLGGHHDSMGFELVPDDHGDYDDFHKTEEQIDDILANPSQHPEAFQSSFLANTHLDMTSDENYVPSKEERYKKDERAVVVGLQSDMAVHNGRLVVIGDWDNKKKTYRVSSFKIDGDKTVQQVAHLNLTHHNAGQSIAAEVQEYIEAKTAENIKRRGTMFHEKLDLNADLVVQNKRVEDADPLPEGVERNDIVMFRRFLRSLLMHSAVGTALGGCMTLVGEPQNLIIARIMGWDFAEFFLKMTPVSLISLPLGLITCFALETTSAFGYGDKMPPHVREVLTTFVDEEYGKVHSAEKAELIVQFVGSVMLVLGLAFHVTEVGFVGLCIAVIVTTFNGITEEEEVAHAFLEAMPFVSLLVVFFGVVAIIQEQGIFAPMIEMVLDFDLSLQPTALFIVNGLLSMVSDNVFVATIFIDTVNQAYLSDCSNAAAAAAAAAAADDSHRRLAVVDCDPNFNMTRRHFDNLAIAINMGTNLPSCATPNGQAAFLFILTSGISPLVQLTYMGMVKMTVPYTFALTFAGLIGVYNLDATGSA